MLLLYSSLNSYPYVHWTLIKYYYYYYYTLDLIENISDHMPLYVEIDNHRSPKCAAITGVGGDMSPHCFIKGPNGSASYTASGSKV